MSNSSIWPIDGTLSSATTPGQSRPGSDSNERVFHIPQNSSITGASLSECLVSYPGHSLKEMLSVYFIAPADSPVCVFVQELKSAYSKYHKQDTDSNKDF